MTDKRRVRRARLGKMTLAEIERELTELRRRRDDLERGIFRLQRVSAWLRARGERARSSGTASAPQSLTNHCRAVLRFSDRNGLTPLGVRRTLAESGFNLDRFVNPMAAVHTVLKRLVSQGEAIAVVGRDGERRFAVRRVEVLALRREEAADDAFLEAILASDSPDALSRIVRDRRR